MPTSDVIEEAKARFKVAYQAEQAQREREDDDLRFQVPELQWPDEVKRQRGSQIAAGVPIPARPMLSIPKLDQPIQLVLNHERRAHLGVQIQALSEDADDDTAEMLQGLYRRIETDSKAGLARSWAFERAVKVGRGYYRVLKEYDQTGYYGDQKLVIKRILHQESVYLDPSAQEMDGCDADWGFITEWMPFERYQRLYGTSDLAGYTQGDFASWEAEEDAPQWVQETDQGRAVRVVEYWRKVYRDRRRVALSDGREVWDDEVPEGATTLDGQSRDERDYTLHWSRLNGIEELETAEWEGRYIPIIPVIGRELIPFGGERRWAGLIGPNKDAQRLFNYAASGSAETAALETKASHALDPQQIEGYEPWWQSKNVRNWPYLPYRRFIGTQDYGPPVPVQADLSKMQVNLVLLQQAGDFLHAGTGAYEPSLGEQSSRAKSGRSILALQQQHDEGNSHWLDNLAQISMTYEAQVILDLIPHIYDRPGRVARILDLYDEPQMIVLNQPFTVDPKTKRPMPVNGQPAQGDVKTYDLRKGRYGVNVTVGKAYQTRLQEGNDRLAQLLQAEPSLLPILGPIWMKFQEWPGHEEAYETLKKMRDHQMPWLAPEGEQGDPEQMVAQLKSQLQQVGGQLQQAVQMIQTKRVEQEAKIQIEQIASQSRLEIERMNNATALAVAKINAAAKGVQIAAQAEDEAIALAHTHAHETRESERDRAHERGMAAMTEDHDDRAAEREMMRPEPGDEG